MGLDMYLTGEESVPYERRKTEDNLSEDGFPLKSRNYDLGYWRKHPDLHGFIVQHCADGKDECNPVYLDEEKIEMIIAAIKADKLPTTTGFFFGQSVNDETEKAEAIEIFSRALQWLRADD